MDPGKCNYFRNVVSPDKTVRGVLSKWFSFRGMDPKIQEQGICVFFFFDF